MHAMRLNRFMTVALPLVFTACVVGPGTYQVASTIPNGVAYCVAAGDTLDNVSDMARQHCAANGGLRAEMTLMDSSATCSRGVYNLGGGQGRLVQFRCTAP
jgi:hypothetical protein